MCEFMCTFLGAIIVFTTHVSCKASLIEANYCANVYSMTEILTVVYHVTSINKNILVFGSVSFGYFAGEKKYRHRYDNVMYYTATLV